MLEIQTKETTRKFGCRQDLAKNFNSLITYVIKILKIAEDNKKLAFLVKSCLNSIFPEITLYM